MWLQSTALYTRSYYIYCIFSHIYALPLFTTLIFWLIFWNTIFLVSLWLSLILKWSYLMTLFILFYSIFLIIGLWSISCNSRPIDYNKIVSHYVLIKMMHRLLCIKSFEHTILSLYILVCYFSGTWVKLLLVKFPL